MRDKKTFFEVLDVASPQSIQTAYSIPIMEIGEMKKFYEENKLSRFRFIKIKVNEEEGQEAVNHLSSFCEQPLIVDANEAFKDVEQCIFFLEKIKKKNIELIEQPMPSSMPDEMLYLKKYSPFKLFADESITSNADFSLLKKMFDGVNIKLMKAGGYLNGVDLLKEAKANGMQTMIGCMVETTLGISSGMNLCSLADYVDLDSFLVVKNEPFNLIEEKDGDLKFIS
jgi:L-alanine-DL-glutamate epimerase-like enolase superfamily enzyme